MRISFCIIGLLTLMVSPAVADLVDTVELVYEVENLAVHSDFDADAGIGGRGQLVWSEGVIAKIHTTGGSTFILYCDVAATFDDCTRYESGGLAHASFALGNLSVDLYNDYGHTTWAGTVTGSLYPGFSYNEGETQDPPELPSSLYGSAIVKIDTWNVPGYEWVEPLGSPAGLTATTTGTTPENIDYNSDWSSTNTVVTVMADESGIPEPATVVLLALGAGLILSRRK